ncbi:hypothetical protein [Aeromonas veronii]|uniref:hypothetical protein n=1 Tax=Aeromonas veronii TaxID=654 RepID=UPI003BA1E852
MANSRQIKNVIRDALKAGNSDGDPSSLKSQLANTFQIKGSSDPLQALQIVAKEATKKNKKNKTKGLKIND